MTSCMTKLHTGQSAKIRQLSVHGDMRRRLLDLGFCDGAKIKCVLKSPSSDPIAYEIKGAVIALRNEITDMISVIT